jgi:hypothetical protein
MSGDITHMTREMSMLNKRKFGRTALRADDIFLLYDRMNGRALGRVVDVSPGVSMMFSDNQIVIPVRTACRMTPSKDDLGNQICFYRHSNIDFGPETRWCHRDHVTGTYECDYSFVKLTSGAYELLQILPMRWESHRTMRIRGVGSDTRGNNYRV